jgi:hypothetical protein
VVQCELKIHEMIRKMLEREKARLDWILQFEEMENAK